MATGTKRSSFWAKLKDGEPKEHLRFIISDPDPEGSVMIVHATAYKGKRYQDSSCIIHPGEYVHITKESYIRYCDADELTETELLTHSFKGIIIINKEQISEMLLARIQEGARNSIDLPAKFQKYFSYF